MIIFGSYFILMVYVMGMTANTISDEERNTFFKELLDFHNLKRTKHGVQRLSWNTDLVTKANEVLKLFNPPMPLPPYEKYGINTYIEDFKGDLKLDAKKIVDSWYNTEADYNYDIPNPSKKTDSFTQMVWMTTELLSLSLFVGKEQYKVVALYFPRGNIKEYYKRNVLRPSPIIQMPFDPLNN